METTQTDRVLGGRYQLGEMLGRGGMADVYDAADTRLGRRVAVKVLRPAMATRPDVRRRFEDEARAAAKLSHPNVVTVYDTGEDEGTPWIVMERLSGETLAARMRPGEPLDTEWALRMAGDVLGALAVAHAAGVMHRDVKPGNILISDDGCAKVADFGIAKSVEGVGDATTAGMLLGTPRYLAPERIEGKPSTASADLYALGVILYEALAGRRAYEGDTPVTVAYAVQHTDPPPLRELRPDLPPALVAAVDRAMARDPGARFATAHEMADALGRVPAGHDAVDLRDAPDADATVEVASAAWAAGSPDPTSIAAAGSLVPPAADGPVRSSRRPRRALDPRLIVVAAVAVVILLLLAGLALSGGASSGNGTGTDNAGASKQSGSPTTAKIREAADRLAVGDGPRGTEAADRLRAIADKMDGGQDASADANSLLNDGTAWHNDRELGDRAYDTLTEALALVPGFDSNATTTTAPAFQLQFGGGKGHKKKGGDD